MTDDQFERLAHQWRWVVGSDVSIKRAHDNVVASGTELEMLRLGYNYRFVKNATVSQDGKGGWRFFWFDPPITPDDHLTPAEFSECLAK